MNPHSIDIASLITNGGVLLASSLFSAFGTLFIVLRHNASTANTDAINSLIADNKALQTILDSHKKRETASRQEIESLTRELIDLRRMLMKHSDFTQKETEKLDQRLDDLGNFLEDTRDKFVASDNQ